MPAAVDLILSAAKPAKEHGSTGPMSSSEHTECTAERCTLADKNNTFAP